MEAPPHPPPIENIKYFSQHDHEGWDLVDYLEWCKEQQQRNYEHSVTLSRWVRSLESIAKDPEESQERRTKAQLLRDKYNRRCEKDRARQWYDPGNGRKGSKTTIYQGPVINAGNDVHINQLQTGITGKRPLEDDRTEDESIVENKRPKSSNPPDVMGETSAEESYKLFKSTFQNMVEKTLIICSGNNLEDCIYWGVTNLFLAGSSWLTKENSILLWIVDLQDPIVAGWFLDEELEELRSLTIPLPKPDKHFAHSVNRFSEAKTAEEYQKILETTHYRLASECYDRSKHFDAGWVNFVIQAMLALFGSYGNLLSCATFREGWFDSNIWSPLIDHCLLGLDGVVVQRKEIKCYALKLIGNHAPRYDAIIHTSRDFAPIEYAAVEVSRSSESEEILPSKKYVADSTKLVIGLHSMLRRLQILVHHDPDAIAKLQVVGMLNAGLNMQIIRMSSINSDVFLVTRGTVRSVPTTVENLGRIFPLMNSISMFKAMIRDSMAVVADYSIRKESRTDGDLYKQLIEQSEL